LKVLFDTNVILDLMLDRAPFAEVSERLVSSAESGSLTGCLSATTVTTIHYLAAKVLGSQRSLDEVRKLLVIFEVAPVNRPVLERALDLGFSDFEDAVLHEAARQAGVEAIVTRNRSDFANSEIPVYSPEELAEALDSQAPDNGE
jgi:predicted nucleic acid-binding protein